MLLELLLGLLGGGVALLWLLVGWVLQPLKVSKEMQHKPMIANRLGIPEVRGDFIVNLFCVRP